MFLVLCRAVRLFDGKRVRRHLDLSIRKRTTVVAVELPQFAVKPGIHDLFDLVIRTQVLPSGNSDRRVFAKRNVGTKRKAGWHRISPP